MRTLGTDAVQQEEGDCFPGCLLYEENPRRLKKALKPLGVVFLTACFAAYLSHTFQSDMKTPSQKMRAKEFLEDEPENSIDTKFRFMERSASDLISSLKTIQDDIYGIKSEVKGGLNEVMVKQTVEIVKKQLQRYDADKTGMSDYALENLGGCILSTRNTVTSKEGTPILSVFGVPLMKLVTEPRYIIQPKVNPGDCWAIKGSQGSAVIKLIDQIVVSAITIEHIPRSVSPTGDISSAPKEVVLYGLMHLDDEKPHKFGTFVYDSDGPPMQTFQVQEPSTGKYGIVEVRIESNQGHPHFTCIYRIRIHGRPPGLKEDNIYSMFLISLVIFIDFKFQLFLKFKPRSIIIISRSK